MPKCVAFSAQSAIRVGQLAFCTEPSMGHSKGSLVVSAGHCTKN